MRELARFERTWNVTASVSDMSLSDDDAIALWRVETRGPNWSVETEYRSLLWGDVVEADFGRSDWVRMPRGIAAFADFILSGTAWRYFAVNWRYGLFLRLSDRDRRQASSPPRSPPPGLACALGMPLPDPVQLR